MKKIIPYDTYQANTDIFTNASCLISGNGTGVKNAVVRHFIDNSYKSDKTMVIIDFCYDRDMDKAFRSSDYPTTVFDISSMGYDYFFYEDSNFDSIIQAIEQKAEALGYTHEERVQVLKYIDLLKELGIPVSDIRSLAVNYSSIDKINQEIERMVRSRAIPASDVPEIIHKLQRAAKGNLIIESVLTELDFSLKADDNAFSLKKLPQRSLAHLKINSRQSDVRKAVLEAIAKDIGDLSNIAVIINAGRNPAADMLFELVNMLTTHDYDLLFISDDIFSDTADHDKFRKLFDINCFTSHSGQSCSVVSAIFGTCRSLEEHYSRNTDHSLTKNNVIDLLFRTNFSEGVTYVPTELPYVRVDFISHMLPNEGIVVSTKNNKVKVVNF